MPFIIRQQSAFTILDPKEHKFKTVVSKITAKTVSTFEEARAEVYTTFANLPSGVQGHYAVISEDSRFVKDIRIGSLLRGFRQPGEITDVA